MFRFDRQSHDHSSEGIRKSLLQLMFIYFVLLLQYSSSTFEFSSSDTFNIYFMQWRTEGGIWGVHPPPEILKALQNCAKLYPIWENC